MLTLTNNEIKDIKKVIRSLENRGILLKGAIKKLLLKKDSFSIFQTAGLPLMKSVLTHLTKNVLLPLGLMTIASVTDAAIQKKFFGFSMTTLIFSNEELDDVMKIVKSLEELGLLIKKR